MHFRTVLVQIEFSVATNMAQRERETYIIGQRHSQLPAPLQLIQPHVHDIGLFSFFFFVANCYRTQTRRVREDY